MLADYHIHSVFSDDSEEEMEAVVKQAIAYQLDEICFTDHVDYGIKVDWADYELLSDEQKKVIFPNVDYPRYTEAIESMRALYGDQITIKTGLEFGVQTHTIAQYEKLFDSLELDFVIMSCHQVEDLEFWNYEYQQGRTAKETNERYYEEIYRCVCQYKKYSVLGHLDMIQRYNDGRYPYLESKAAIEQILSQVIADGKGIEVNTSSFRYGLSELMPEHNILKLYYEMGDRDFKPSFFMRSWR